MSTATKPKPAAAETISDAFKQARDEGRERQEDRAARRRGE
ncbi:hypothetical protein ABZ468_48420 [Streptomyces sp. NPDC005708]